MIQGPFCSYKIHHVDENRRQRRRAGTIRFRKLRKFRKFRV